MQKYSDTVLDTNGNVIRGATVTVQNYPAGTSATVYGSNAVGANVNPLTTDANGYFEFWTTNGQYSLQISKTGITTRTVTNILIQDVQVSVTEYGAKGDGVTDDVTAIQAAIDAVNTAGGGMVTFPLGTFLVSTSIRYKTNVGLVGAGRGATTIKLKSGSTLNSSLGIIQPDGYGTSLPAVGYYSKNNYIAHMTVDGNIAGNGGHVYGGVEAAFVKDCLVLDVEAMNCGECGFHGQATNSGTDKSANIVFDSCIAHNNTADGFQIGGVMCDNCLSYSNTVSGFDSVGNYTGATDNIFTQVINCRAELNTNCGFATNLQLGTAVRTLFSNCVAYKNTALGFSISMDQTAMDNCVAQLNTSSGASIQANYVKVTGGMFMNNGTTASGLRAGIEVNAGSFISITGALLTDNQGVKTQQYAFALSAPGTGASNTIRGCQMTGNATNTINTNAATDWRIMDCDGFNPVGAFNGVSPKPANPVVGASPFTLTNNYGYPIRVFIGNGTISDITLAGTSTGLTIGLFTVGPGEALAITYTVAPTLYRVYGM